MIRVRDIDHIVLRVRDAERSLAFYRDVLGCALETRRDDIGLLQLRAGRSLIDLVPLSGKLGAAGGAGPGEEGRNVDHFCVRVEPFDEPALRAQMGRGGLEAGAPQPRGGAEGPRPGM
jgi:catechol 2,3-dioxygenase-like lactoylglutathione lyase family enzyme